MSLPTSPRFRRILLAYTVNKLGTWIGYVALVVVVYDHTHSAPTVAGLLVASNLLPALLSPAVVARIEASQRSRSLTQLYLIEAATAVALATLLWHFVLAGVLVLAAIDGTAALAANSLLRATSARVALEGEEANDGDPETAQRKANAALNVAWTATFALGPAIAGPLLAAVGGPIALLIDAATFLVCGLLLVDLRSHVQEVGEPGVRSRLASAWRYLRAVPELRKLLATEAVAIVFFASAPPVEVLYAKETLHAGDSGFGLLLAVWGAGTMLGSFVFARWVRRSLVPLLSLGTFAVGISYLGWAAAPTLTLACVAAMIGGMGNGVQWASVISAVQRLTPADLQGSLMSAVESMGALCPALGYMLGGAIAAVSSPRVTFLIAGSVAVCATCVFLRISRPESPGARTGALKGSDEQVENSNAWPEDVVASMGAKDTLGSASDQALNEHLVL